MATEWYLKLKNNPVYIEQRRLKSVAYNAAYRNRPEVKEYRKELRKTKAFKVWAKKYSAKYRSDPVNKQKLLAYDKEYRNRKDVKARLQTPYYKIINLHRSRITNLIKAKKANKLLPTKEIFSAKIVTVIQHIENQFQSGMTWQNHGKWHIDHIKPLAAFNLFTLKEQKKAFHYTNLQPLWAKDNLSKSDNY